MLVRLTDDQVAARLADLAGWSRQGNEITKLFQFGTFPQAIAFVVQLAFAAEAAGHHPDVDIRYTRVTVSLTTHDAGGLTSKDFDLAAKADELV